MITQAFLNDLVRDLNLPKESAELLGSRLQHNNLLAPNTTYSWYRRREKGLVRYFSMEETFVYSHNVAGLLQAMGCAYDPTEWRLFIDSCIASLKCVLLHNGNRYQSWSRGHQARGQGQGHKKNPRPRPRLRTAFPRTDTLEAKDQGHSRKCFPKTKGLQKSFSGNLKFIGVARIFDWGGLNHKSHAMTSSKNFLFFT